MDAYEKEIDFFIFPRFQFPTEHCTHKSIMIERTHLDFDIFSNNVQEENSSNKGQTHHQNNHRVAIKKIKLNYKN